MGASILRARLSPHLTDSWVEVDGQRPAGVVGLRLDYEVGEWPRAAVLMHPDVVELEALLMDGHLTAAHPVTLADRRAAELADARTAIQQRRRD